MTYALIKTGVSMVALAGIVLGVSYYASVPAGAGAAGVFMAGWLNGVGDGILQYFQ